MLLFHRVRSGLEKLACVGCGIPRLVSWLFYNTSWLCKIYFVSFDKDGRDLSGVPVFFRPGLGVAPSVGYDFFCEFFLKWRCSWKWNIWLFLGRTRLEDR